VNRNLGCHISVPCGGVTPGGGEYIPPLTERPDEAVVERWPQRVRAELLSTES